MVMTHFMNINKAFSQMPCGSKDIPPLVTSTIAKVPCISTLINTHECTLFLFHGRFLVDFEESSYPPTSHMTTFSTTSTFSFLTNMQANFFLLNHGSNFSFSFFFLSILRYFIFFLL